MISLFISSTLANFRTILCSQYHIFEDHTHVSEVYVKKDESRVCIRSMSSRPPNIISPGSPIFVNGPIAHRIPTSCLASGRIVYFPRDNDLEIVVVDFLNMCDT